MVTRTGALSSYLENKGREWSGGGSVDRARVAHHVRASDRWGLANEFRPDADRFCSALGRPSRLELIRVAILALDLASPEVADVAEIVVGGLELSCGIRDERKPGPDWVPVLVVGGFAALVAGVIALSTRRR